MHSNRYTSEGIPVCEAVELCRLKWHLIQYEINVCSVEEQVVEKWFEQNNHNVPAGDWRCPSRDKGNQQNISQSHSVEAALHGSAHLPRRRLELFSAYEKQPRNDF